MEKYNKEAIFHLPGIYRFFGLYIKLIDLYTNRKELFKDNVKIGSVYDAPPGCIWNGGRLMLGNISKPELLNVRDFLYDNNIPIRFTFTNNLLEKKHTYDTFSNMVINEYNNGRNEILCNNKVLEEYLREYNYNYKFISSTTKRLLTADLINKECDKDYKLVVLDYILNKDFETLKKIEQKEKIEILCNAVCLENCPRRAEHYTNISRCQLEFNPDEVMVCDCSFSSFNQVKTRQHFVSEEDINDYLNMGFKNFKLEGRTTNYLDLVEILLYYLIKDSCKDEVREFLQR